LNLRKSYAVVVVVAAAVVVAAVLVAAVLVDVAAVAVLPYSRGRKNQNP
jgi:hypothetical protein